LYFVISAMSVSRLNNGKYDNDGTYCEINYPDKAPGGVCPFY
jgi:hypothetical protein